MAWSVPRTWTTGEVVTAAMMNTDVRDNLNFLFSGMPAAFAYHSTTQSVTSATFTAVALDSELYDTDTIHDTAVNNSRLTCKTAGKYLIIGHLAWSALGAAALYQHSARLWLNGATDIAQVSSTDNHNGEEISEQVSVVYDLAVNDFVELQAYQNTGGSETLQGQIAGATFHPRWGTSLLMARLG